MIRSELIRKLARDNPQLKMKDAEQAVNTVFDEITEALARGGRVELRGFGTFSVKCREARPGRNPRTGEPVDIETKYVPYFRAGKLLHERLNGKAD